MPLSYNDYNNQKSELRHLFIPSPYNFVAEAIIAVVALILINLSTLSNNLLNANTGVATSPLSVLQAHVSKILGRTQFMFVQKILLFILWAVVGALIYILVFRCLQLFIRLRGSVHEGAQLIESDHSAGAMRYFASLHDFFWKVIIMVSGIAVFLVGVLVCFGIASQELATCLNNTFPENMGPLLLSLVGAFLAIRMAAIGISLMSRRFRIWYNF
jgi:hypothetical protein